MTPRDRVRRAFLRWALNAVLNLLVLVGVLRRLTRVKPQPRYQFHLEKAPRTTRTASRVGAGPVVMHTEPSASPSLPILQEEVRRMETHLANQRRNRGTW